MSVVVAGLFDSELSASKAMDQLMKQHFDDMDTRVIDPTSRAADSGTGVVPLVPNTGGQFGDATMGGLAAGGAVLGGSDRGWFGNMDEVERQFYTDGMREGSSLALVKVKNDEDAQRVRQLLHDYGARTYVKD